MVQSVGDSFKDQFARHYKDAAEKIGRFNLAIFGKTGAGKSTLINAIFGEAVAKTGIGEPVTQDEHLYIHRSGALGLLDTRGVEIGDDTETIIDDLRRVITERRSKPLKEQIHLAWYCVRASDRRFEATEAEFIMKLDKLGLPVICVLTQVPRNSAGGYHPDALQLAEAIEKQKLPIVGSKVIMTMATADEFTGHAQHGLEKLLDASFRAAPRGVETALAAAQQIDMGRKRNEAMAIAGTASTAAAAAGAVPIPFSDAFLLVPIQLGMMGGIANVYGIDLDKATIASVAATAAATNVGRSAVGGLLKLIPGVGTLVGGAINAAFASGFTMAMGVAWALVCQKLAEGGLRLVDGALDVDAIRSVFVGEFKGQVSRRLKK
ncbi:GTPase [Mycolicibacterium sp.]|uniref:GTPase family protein n=1 Tax=Mycolicibacterium sp. TaxID=2320850 RepID=UPI0025F69350|nr:GTPase [Mycolicibacterium sp.]MCB9409355.1 50S ribosome-binding GTPase [Mycolicibacterium sp.]